MTGFEAGHGARRALHRARPGREGDEAELVERLTAELAPPAVRDVLARCLEGGVSPPAALAQLLLTCRNVTALRELVDEVTARADEDSRASDALVRDRADALTRLFVDNAPALARAMARWTRADAGAVCDALAADAPPADAPPTDGSADAYYEGVFARVVRDGADAPGNDPPPP